MVVHACLPFPAEGHSSEGWRGGVRARGACGLLCTTHVVAVRGLRLWHVGGEAVARRVAGASL